MPTVKLVDETTTDPKVRAIFADIKATKKIERIPNFWRALAADPPVLLMDEPFGAVDPIVRSALQTELLAILIDHGLPLPEAFRLAGQASSDPLLLTAGQYIEQDLMQGVPLGEALRTRRLVPELIAWMTSFGEQRGALGKTLPYDTLGEIRRKLAEASPTFRAIDSVTPAEAGPLAAAGATPAGANS